MVNVTSNDDTYDTIPDPERLLAPPGARVLTEQREAAACEQGQKGKGNRESRKRKKYKGKKKQGEGSVALKSFQRARFHRVIS